MLYLNDLGLLSACGGNKQETLQAVLNGDRSGLTANETFIPQKTVYIGAVKSELPDIEGDLQVYNCRNNRLLLAAASQIRPTIERMINLYGAKRIGIVLGTSTSGIRNTELALSSVASSGQKPSEFHYKQQQLGAGADFLAHYLSLKGPAITVSTACSSSGRAFLSARRLINMDICDAVIVGGADSLCRYTINGFNALESIAREKCKPFGQNRDGINISEASALFVLSREEAEIRLAGIGANSDAYHFSAPDPGGETAMACMQSALQDAQLDPQSIDYINLHGTATPLNDAMESKAVYQLFADQVAASSSKGMTGHALGAAAALELGICYQLLSSSPCSLPPNINEDDTDPTLPAIKLIRQPQNAPHSLKICLSNSFAFGGKNVSLILAKS